MRKSLLMKRRKFIQVTGAAGALLPLMLASYAKDDSGKRPNVLLIVADQHKADVMGNAGHPVVKTPRLDRLAESGVRFDRVYCQDAICVPSRTSFMTGLYPRTTPSRTQESKP